MSCITTRITLAPAGDPDALGTAWRALEAAAGASFFQSWTWVGCRAAARFSRPLLLRAERDGDTVGLALLNRTRRGLWLHETGDAAEDAAYIEHNGLLLADPALLAECLGVLLGAGAVRLSGVDGAHLAAARAAGAVRLRRAQAAPHVDLAALAGRDYLAVLSANTRQQLRRSDRAYGAIVIEEAGTPEEALAFLDALAVLHQARWTARGKPGAFANPAFRAFHRSLIARAWPRREAMLLRVSAGGRAIGYLYNFRHQGRVLAYQSGFDYAAAPPHAKPGLSCHHAAIRHARAEGARIYDFLAGEDRYKTSLATAATPLYWLDAARRWSAAGLVLRLSTWRNSVNWPRLVSSQPKRSA